MRNPHELTLFSILSVLIGGKMFTNRNHVVGIATPARFTRDKGSLIQH